MKSRNFKSRWCCLRENGLRLSLLKACTETRYWCLVYIWRCLKNTVHKIISNCTLLTQANVANKTGCMSCNKSSSRPGRSVNLSVPARLRELQSWQPASQCIDISDVTFLFCSAVTHSRHLIYCSDLLTESVRGCCWSLYCHGARKWFLKHLNCHLVRSFPGGYKQTVN